MSSGIEELPKVKVGMVGPEPITCLRGGKVRSGEYAQGVSADEGDGVKEVGGVRDVMDRPEPKPTDVVARNEGSRETECP